MTAPGQTEPVEVLQRPTVRVINPLGVALAHYEQELRATLELAGATVQVVSFPEPSAGVSRSAWIRRYLQVLRAAGPPPARRILCWPVLGYGDVGLAASLQRQVPTTLIVHDPLPLVGAIGYGRAARMLARRLGNKVELAVHSEAAADEAARLGIPVRVRLPHPMLAPVQRRAPSRATSRVVVLGQYKPDRDLSALEQIAAGAPSHWQLLIRGRGWPDVRGWDVQDRFLTEAEFDQELVKASVVVVPYRRFYQSGVAVRCFELGVPCVGTSGSGLAELWGHAPWLVSDSNWVAAVARALEPDALGPGHLQAKYAEVVGAWRAWLGADHASDPSLLSPEAHGRNG